MKPPVKDRDTVPWISQAEIPAVKIMLSAWRKLRKDKNAVNEMKTYVDQLKEELSDVVESESKIAAEAMFAITYAEEILRRSCHDKRRRTENL